ncbi:hypothetical protein GAY31_31215, partial [Azospirillum brasilense]|nr:hypothetical protein [Azospirillum brasilense]
MGDVRVRKAGLADAGAVTGLVAALLSELTAGQSDTPRAVMLAVAESLLSGSESYTVFLAEDRAGRPGEAGGGQRRRVEGAGALEAVSAGACGGSLKSGV